MAAYSEISRSSKSREVDNRLFDICSCNGSVEEGDACEHSMSASRKQSKHPPGLVFIRRLAKDRLVDDDDRIRTENELTIPPDRPRFRFGEALHKCLRRLTREVSFYHVSGPHDERNTR